MCALFRAVGFWVGRLNAKIDSKSSEMAGNESEINKRNNNFDNFSLFLISIRRMIKKKPPRISEIKSRMTIWISWKVGGKALSLPLRDTCLVPCTGHTTVCHSATDASEGYFLVSKSSLFRTRSLVFWNFIELPIFRGVGQSYVDHLIQESHL